MHSEGPEVVLELLFVRVLLGLVVLLSSSIYLDLYLFLYFYLLMLHIVSFWRGKAQKVARSYCCGGSYDTLLLVIVFLLFFVLGFGLVLVFLFMLQKGTKGSTELLLFWGSYDTLFHLFSHSSIMSGKGKTIEEKKP